MGQDINSKRQRGQPRLQKWSTLSKTNLGKSIGKYFLDFSLEILDVIISKNLVKLIPVKFLFGLLKNLGRNNKVNKKKSRISYWDASKLMDQKTLKWTISPYIKIHTFGILSKI